MPPVSSHTTAMADHLARLTDTTRRASDDLAELIAAPMGEPSQVAKVRLRDTTRELRHHAAELAAWAGAAEAVR